MDTENRPDPSGLKKDALTLFLIFSCIALIVAGLVRYWKTEKIENQLTANNQALQNELKITKDKAGRETARALALQASNRDFKNQLAEKGGIVEALKKEVAKAKETQAVAIVTTETQTPFKIKTVVKYDTIYKNPVYTARDSTEYGVIVIRAAVDSVTGNYVNFERGTFRQVNEKTGFLKPRRPVVYYKSSNPNTRITGLNAYAVKEPPPNKILNIAKGAGIGAALVLILQAIR